MVPTFPQVEVPPLHAPPLTTDKGVAVVRPVEYVQVQRSTAKLAP